jgi:hypothetical protein
MLKVDEIQRFGFTEILEYINKNYAWKSLWFKFKCGDLFINLKPYK